MSSFYDDGKERYGADAPRSFVIGCNLIASLTALAAGSINLALTPGDICIDGHLAHLAGRANITFNDGNTLTASHDVYGVLIAYWNPTSAKVVLLVIDGTEADTGEASAPSASDITDALPDSSWPYVELGRVMFSASAASVVTCEDLDEGARPYGIIKALKEAGTGGDSHQTDPFDADASLYRYRDTLQYKFDLEDIADGDIITDCDLPPIYGTIAAIRAVCTSKVTTASKATTIAPHVGASAVTGGTVALTSALLADLGAVVDGAAITAGNTFVPGDTFSLAASSTTAFVEGAVVVELEIHELITG